jgi:hypothetical protein
MYSQSYDPLSPLLRVDNSSITDEDTSQVTFVRAVEVTCVYLW